MRGVMVGADGDVDVEVYMRMDVDGRGEICFG